MLKDRAYNAVGVENSFLSRAQNEAGTPFDLLGGPFIEQNIIPKFFPFNRILTLTKSCHGVTVLSLS